MNSQPSMAMPSNTAASPAPSSHESFDGEDDAANPLSSAQWQVQGETSPSGTPSSSSQQPRAAPPLQKRRRVTRACDECRRKKIKCDGKQPCTHCVVYSYDCTYDQPSNRRRNPAPQYIESLEVRLHRAEALLRTFVPNVDLNDPNVENMIQQRQANPGTDSIETETPQAKVKATAGNEDQDAELQSMIETTGQLDLDDYGHWDFHGGSSGAVFLKRMREQFGGLLGTAKAPFLPRAPRTAVSSQLESPRSNYDSPNDHGLPNTVDLPSKEAARVLSVNALSCACALMRFVHEPTYWGMFDRIYGTLPDNFGDEENRFLPLLYTILAVGSMFSEDSPLQLGELPYKTGIDQGLRYFRAARQMMDITDCRDIVSLQAILFMILFLQSTSNLSTCYSYIGVALRSALRMGLHRNLAGSFSLIEREIRRRVFWIIRKMDTYVSALLGFPRMLSDDDIDQELPLSVDDECITKDMILPMPRGKTSVSAASNAHTRLITTLAKVIKYIYPVTGVEQCTKEGSNPAYKISHAKIREVERDLQEWLDKLPMALRPGGDTDEQMIRAQQLLRMAYAHVQMMLYRPFLHYVSKRSTAGKKIDDRSYACAAACVSVSRNIIHITAEMQRRGLLVGAYWFTMYTTFFAILSLVYFVLENPDKAGSQEILADACSGRDALKALARRSMAADRCSVALGSLFEQLPEKLMRTSSMPVVSKKKRSAPYLEPTGQQEVRRSPDPPSYDPKINKSGLAQRATTFPTTLTTSLQVRQSSSFESPRYSDQSFRHSFHELGSPDISTVGTPDSGSTGHGLQPAVSFQQSYIGTSDLPDMGAMMFPSADPFAYPNQPMMEFDNQQQKNQLIGSYIDGSSVPQNSIFMSNSGAGQQNPYDNLEGQLFGPLPPYLMQNQPNADMGNMDINMMAGMAGPHDGNNRQGGVFAPDAASGMNFEDIFAGSNEEWGNMMDHGYRQ